MDDAKIFEGKSLDEAIRAACQFYDSPREKLEIDIMQDAKSGIFGLVGVRKAQIRARRSEVRARVGDILSSREPAPAPPRREARPPRVAQERAAPVSADLAPHAVSGSVADAEAADGDDRNEVREANPYMERDGSRNDSDRGRSRRRGGRESADESAPATAPVAAPVQRSEPERRPEPVRPPARPMEPRPERPERPERTERPERSERPERTERTPSRAQDPDNRDMDLTDILDESTSDRMPYVPLEQLDQELLRTTIRETTLMLITPIIGEVNLAVEIGDGRVDVHINGEDDLGLLIGREGQTLASLQYLTSRIVARRMGSPVRVQLDAGDYRERQDEKLRELALILADRAKTTGRVCPTRPLSSYQRRIVHMTLQADPAIQTRSAGEGPLKRVVIQRVRGEAR